MTGVCTEIKKTSGFQSLAHFTILVKTVTRVKNF